MRLGRSRAQPRVSASRYRARPASGARVARQPQPDWHTRPNGPHACCGCPVLLADSSVAALPACRRSARTRHRVALPMSPRSSGTHDSHLLARRLAEGLGPAHLARVALHLEILVALGLAEDCAPTGWSAMPPCLAFSCAPSSERASPRRARQGGPQQHALSCLASLRTNMMPLPG